MAKSGIRKALLRRRRSRRRRLLLLAKPFSREEKQAPPEKEAEEAVDDDASSSSSSEEEEEFEEEEDENGIASRAFVTVAAGDRVVLVGSCGVRCSDGAAAVAQGAVLTDELVVHSPTWLPALTIEVGSAGRIALRSLRPDEAQPMARATADAASWKDDERTTRIQGCVAVLNGELPKCAYTEPERWSHAAANFANADDEDLAVLVMGAKATGKSTFVRLLCNARLSSTKGSVALLECDLGQPMLGPPGFISLRLVSDPLLQPAHSCCSSQESSVLLEQYYLGDVSPKDAPRSYTCAISKCVASWRQELRKHAIPLVVNTGGWIAGLGAELIAAQLEELKPASTYVVGEASFVRGSRLERALTDNDQRVTYVGSFRTDKEQRQTAAASARRALSLAAYFGGCAKAEARNGSLADPRFAVAKEVMGQPVFAAKWTMLSVGMVGAAADTPPETNDDALRALIGSIVGLSTLPEGVETAVPASESGPAILQGDVADIAPCFGLAIVRGLDLLKKEILLTSPVPEDQIAKANLLLRGLQMPPTSLLYSPETASSFPFLSCESLAADLATAMKSRNNIGRSHSLLTQPGGTGKK